MRHCNLKKGANTYRVIRVMRKRNAKALFIKSCRYVEFNLLFEILLIISVLKCVLWGIIVNKE
jgi:hypothetical protein